jgi:ATP-dependent helicase/DNAse subunit B
MLLLTGPAGSGKTFRILERLRAAFERRDSGVRLLTPTATMARHFQNRLAREGFVFRPGLIQTLSRFVDAYAADLPQVSEPLLYLLVEAAAHRVNRPEFARVVHLPGFCAALARAMEEFSAAGCDAVRLADSLPRKTVAPLGEAFLAVYREVDRELARRGLATRSQRLLHAAEHIAREGLTGVHAIWLDGFHAVPDPELAVIDALCRHADVTLTLPAAAITESTRARLLAMGFAEEVCDRARVPARTELCEAPSIEREADEIARHILEHAAAGRPFREMGIIVRSPKIYESLLSTTLDRFGIPACFYFDADLSRLALVRYLAGAVDAMLGGWEHAETLAVLRLAPGMACDAFDFKVRSALPGAGLAALKTIAVDAEPSVIGLLQSFEVLEVWRALTLSPADWAVRLKKLRELFRPPRPEPATFETAMGRGQAAALDLFEGALEEAGRALAERPIPLSEFWRAAKSVLRLTPLRVDDRRRNVVHVLGAHEARQWQLPVVFICGLVEQQFPRFHTQDPFFPDAARAQLQRAGIRLRTAADFEAEERFLFDWIVTRATAELTLSGVSAVPIPWQSVRPQAGRHAGQARPASIIAPDLVPVLADRHSRFSPTPLESYLQCAFQFFGRYTLRLEAAPTRPEERLDFRAQGTIVHAVLSEIHRAPQPLDEAFDRIFRLKCEELRVLPGYRTEALRHRMLADLRALVEDSEWAGEFETRTEQKFRYTLAEDVEISGRIDRMDVTPDGSAFVIDYKYSGAQGTRNRAADRNLLQPQLYVLAVERLFGLRAAGMFYWGLKGGIQRKGWSEPFPPGWREQAIATTMRVAGEIRAGRVEPGPADPGKCRFCDFRDVCRFEAATGELAEGSSSWD